MVVGDNLIKVNPINITSSDSVTKHLLYSILVIIVLNSAPNRESNGKR